MTAYFKKCKISKGESIAQSLKERFEYGQNPDKTQGGELISSYACDHMTADAEFHLSKTKYKAVTVREQHRDANVLCYQIRQSFKPGEITPEEANRVGYETAMAGRRASMLFSLPPIQPVSISITTLTTIPLCRTVRTSSRISSALRGRYGGSRIESAWKTIFP